MAAATRHSTSARLAPYLPNKPPRLDPLSQSQARSGAGPAYKICALALKRATFLVSGRFATSVAVSHPHTTLVHSNDVDTHKSHIIKLDKNRRGEAQCQSVRRLCAPWTRAARARRWRESRDPPTFNVHFPAHRDRLTGGSPGAGTSVARSLRRTQLALQCRRATPPL